MSGGGETTVRRLLVIDDEPEIVEIIQLVAEGLGFEVVASSDPEEFPLIYRNDLDFVILDLSMPKIDGVELIRFLADNRSQAAVILMSGFDAQVLNAARQLGVAHGINVVGTLEKPLDISALEMLLGQAPTPEATPYPVRGTNELPSVDELREAIASRALAVHYQPKVSLRSGELRGFEALARWRHPVKGMIPPYVFVDLAEKNGLIGPLTDVILEMALDQCGHWLRRGLKTKVAINFSPQTLIDLEFPDSLVARTSSHGLSPSQVVIEVTETSVIEKLSTSLDILTRLRMKGFNLSIDDFGTGFASLQQLRKIPFKELKIDQSFVTPSDRDAEARTIVESIASMAKNLGMTLVAEGIETRGNWDLLATLDCDEGQGYFISRPLAAEQVEDWVRQWRLPER